MYQQGDDMSFAETVPGVQHIPVPVADVGYAIQQHQQHYQQQQGGGVYDNDLRQLHALCEAAHEDDEESWERVRTWFRSHTATDAREAAMQLGEYETTPLHAACRNCPPYDVVESIITAAPNTTMMVDTFGWLPLHYACANGAYDHIILRLADAYPEGKIVTDNRGRTPLHFALGNIDRQASANTVLLLSSTGASNVAEENGMLPLHYACAYGASEDALHLLTDNDAISIVATDNKGRTPLHFAMGNADRDASPAIVRLLLSQYRDMVDTDSTENGQLPLHLLATRAQTLTDQMQSSRENAEKCLEFYLHARPRPTADFLTALQSLPEWLSDRAVVTPVVQRLLNDKIAQRFPTAIIMLDFYCLCGVIITFAINAQKSVENRYAVEQGTIIGDAGIDTIELIPCYVGACYFLIREIVQIMSLASLGLFQTWLTDATNAIDVSFIVLVMFWTSAMDSGTAMNIDVFRMGTALTLLVLATSVLSFLKSMLIDFAVFVGGVFYVTQRLAAFLMALGVILVAFSQMFVTTYQRTEYCADPSLYPNNQSAIQVIGDCVTNVPFCGFWSSFLKVYTMLLGEVNDQDFEKGFATVLFVIFMFLVVILLANVLIAIVTDSYGVIKNERAAIVFWSNRLDFVAEMDVISNGPWKKRLRRTFPFLVSDLDDGMEYIPFGREIWKKLMELYDNELVDLKPFSFEFFFYSVVRAVVAFVIIPFWLIVGIFTVGWMWPPQIRVMFFTQRISHQNSRDLNESEQRTIQVNNLKTEIKELGLQLREEIGIDKREVGLIKTQLTDAKADIDTEMEAIKSIVASLFELQSRFGT